jgi:hypothetical protein
MQEGLPFQDVKEPVPRMPPCLRLMVMLSFACASCDVADRN